MLVTFKPLVVSGMTTAPPGPLYLEILRVPSLLVVKTNWACAISEENSKRRNNESLAGRPIFAIWVVFIREHSATNHTLSQPVRARNRLIPGRVAWNDAMTLEALINRFRISSAGGNSMMECSRT